MAEAIDDLLRLNARVKELNSPNDTQPKLEPGTGQGYNGKATKAYEAYLSILDDVDQAIKSGMSAVIMLSVRVSRVV